MGEPRADKAAVVTEVGERLDSAEAAVLTEYRGLDVPAMAELRSALRASGGTYKIYKNTLVRIAARSHGIGTERCLRDYFRLKGEQARPAIDRLVASGELVPVQVPGWTDRAFLYAGARLPQRVHAEALLSPFDSLIWQRERVEALWDFRYRLEIYVPAPQRVHGYYVLPFLLGDTYVARVDLKYDRDRGVLLVRSAFAEEPGPDAAAATRWPTRSVVVGELAAELATTATWLGADTVTVDEDARGELIGPLRGELRRPCPR